MKKLAYIVVVMVALLMAVGCQRSGMRYVCDSSPKIILEKAPKGFHVTPSSAVLTVLNARLLPRWNTWHVYADEHDYFIIDSTLGSSKERAMVEGVIVDGLTGKIKREQGALPDLPPMVVTADVVPALLITKGADVTITNSQGKTLLYLATQMRDANMVKALLIRGANMNTGDPAGMTPLHLSAFMGTDDIAELLISRGARIEVQDNMGRTPLHYAAIEGRIGTAKILIEKGARVNVRCDGYSTPLHYASYEGHAAFVALLLSHGADEGLEDADGKSALSISAARGHTNVTAVIRAHAVK